MSEQKEEGIKVKDLIDQASSEKTVRNAIRLHRREILKKFKIIGKDGVTRKADLTNKDDVEELSKKMNVMIKMNGVSTNPEVGFIQIGPHDIDFKSKVLPVDPNVFFIIMTQYELEENKKVCLLPLITIPVFTPKLLCMLTGEKLLKVMDSFSVIRVYSSFIKYSLSSDLVTSRKKIVCDELIRKFDNKTLGIPELFSVLSKCTFKGLTVDYINVISKEFSDGSLEREKLCDALSHINSADKGLLPDDIECCENIMSEHTSFQIQLNDVFMNDFIKIGESPSNGVDQFSDNIDQLNINLYKQTHMILKIYETTIMRLIGADGIPLNRRRAFVNATQFPNIKNLEKEFVVMIDKKRQEVNYNRSVFIGTANTVEVTEGTEKKTIVIPFSKVYAEDTVKSAIPEPKDWRSLYDFIQHNPESKEQLENDLRRYEGFMHEIKDSLIKPKTESEKAAELAELSEDSDSEEEDSSMVIEKNE